MILLRTMIFVVAMLVAGSCAVDLLLLFLGWPRDGLPLGDWPHAYVVKFASFTTLAVAHWLTRRGRFTAARLLLLGLSAVATVLCVHWALVVFAGRADRNSLVAAACSMTVAYVCYRVFQAMEPPQLHDDMADAQRYLFRERGTGF